MADHSHTVDVSLEEEEVIFKAEPLSKGRISSPAPYLPNLAPTGIRTHQLDHPRQPLKTSAIQEMHYGICLAQITKSCFSLLIPQTFVPWTLIAAWRADVLPRDMFSHKQETGNGCAQLDVYGSLWVKNR